MANTLGVIAVLVGLGAMFGQMLENSGGADALARFLVAKFGEKNAPWSLALTGFVVAIPVFFDIGFIILVPIVYGLTVRTGNSIISYGLPLLIGLTRTHCGRYDCSSRHRLGHFVRRHCWFSCRSYCRSVVRTIRVAEGHRRRS
jgi:H+/gluconate symporter-like permease